MSSGTYVLKATGTILRAAVTIASVTLPLNTPPSLIASTIANDAVQAINCYTRPRVSVTFSWFDQGEKDTFRTFVDWVVSPISYPGGSGYSMDATGTAVECGSSSANRLTQRTLTCTKATPYNSTGKRTVTAPEIACALRCA